jgi:transcriptional regulator with XRE-family HTH domain
MTSRRSADPTAFDQIGLRLRLTRAALGYTQTIMGTLCGATGINPAATWANYEAGYRRINIDHAQTLCGRIGITMDWIYLGNIQGVPDPLRGKIQQQMQAEGPDPRPISRPRR